MFSDRDDLPVAPAWSDAADSPNFRRHFEWLFIISWWSKSNVCSSVSVWSMCCVTWQPNPEAEVCTRKRPWLDEGHPALALRRAQFAAENGGHVKKKYTPKFPVNSAWDFHLFIDIPLLAHSQRSCCLGSADCSPAAFYPSSHFTFPSLYLIILWVKREQAPNPDTRENPIHFQQPNVGRCIEWVNHL